MQSLFFGSSVGTSYLSYFMRWKVYSQERRFEADCSPRHELIATRAKKKGNLWETSDAARALLAVPIGFIFPEIKEIEIKHCALNQIPSIYTDRKKKVEFHHKLRLLNELRGIEASFDHWGIVLMLSVYPDCYQFDVVGGKRILGESSFDCVKRECLEETGIDIGSPRRVDSPERTERFTYLQEPTQFRKVAHIWHYLTLTGNVDDASLRRFENRDRFEDRVNGRFGNRGRGRFEDRGNGRVQNS